jgi:hypothetical protein
VKKGLSITLEQARAHATRHGYALQGDPAGQHSAPPAQNAVAGLAGGQIEPKTARGRQMNKTEAEFARILEAQKRKGEIVEWRFEGIRLKWGDTMHYKPDFVVRRAALPEIYRPPLLLIEVKGGHIWDRDLVRFKGCRAEWKLAFDFALWQKKGGNWTRLL